MTHMGELADGYEDLPQLDAAAIARTQVVDSLVELERRPNEYLRWPWPELDAVTGPLGAGGVVWFVCAFSSIGKTTFVTSLIELWRNMGKVIYVMPLETRAREFRTHLACVQTGHYPGAVLSGEAKSRPDWLTDVKPQIAAAIEAQRRAPFVDQVMISEQQAINVRGLEKGLKESKSFGADVVIIDHIDHIAEGSGTNLYAESRAVNHAALQMAKDNNLILLFTSQLNLEIAKSPDHLAKFGPPRDGHVLMGNTKRQVATGMIGLFRKPRDRKQLETDEEYNQAIKDARAGKVEPPEILDPNIMGVNAMKLRHFGSREGTRVYLGFDRGRVVSLNERDQYTTRRG